MVNDFVTGAIGTDRAETIIPPLGTQLLPAARTADVPVIYVNDAHLPTDPELDIWGEHAMKGSNGAETVPKLEPHEQDVVLEKRFYDAFYETGLDSYLRFLKIDTVILAGLHTNMCIRHTAASALFHGYSIVVPENGVNAFTEEDHQNGLAYLEQVYDADIVTIEQLTERWKASPKQRQ